MITEAALHRTGLAQMAVQLFGERHCKLDPIPHCTPTDVIAAYRSLAFIDQPWPGPTTANAMVHAVQTELDATCLKDPN